MRFLTKKQTFVLSLAFLAIPLSAILMLELYSYETAALRSYRSLLADIVRVTFWPAVLLFITSLMTYPLKIQVFKSWRKFVIWAMPLTVILTFFIVNMESSGGGFGVPSIHPGVILLPILYSLFFLISILVITVSWWRNRE